MSNAQFKEWFELEFETMIFYLREFFSISKLVKSSISRENKRGKWELNKASSGLNGKIKKKGRELVENFVKLFPVLNVF